MSFFGRYYTYVFISSVFIYPIPMEDSGWQNTTLPTPEELGTWQWTKQTKPLPLWRLHFQWGRQTVNNQKVNGTVC